MSGWTLGKSEAELLTEEFAERMTNLYPNIDREELYETIIHAVNEMAAAVEEEEEWEE
jgi:hypothetical protein